MRVHSKSLLLSKKLCTFSLGKIGIFKMLSSIMELLSIQIYAYVDLIFVPNLEPFTRVGLIKYVVYKRTQDSAKFLSIKLMLHGTTFKDDFLRNESCLV